ncbi:unnamed protein product [Allacma fusca]|uniref:Peptidase aspartic putative domain-containing protein n=1 Tax=Allacma fusca TaxID=39272 RepID=A0A8J2KSA2_9HEXA|nr:unnamed protein product [Allacma fusca]
MGSKAREVVEIFPPSTENYPKVIYSLKERFGKDEILLEVYVRELLRLVLKNVVYPKDQPSILTLYDKLETQLRALETLGVTSDTFAAMLYLLVESCLPKEMLRTWERITVQYASQPGANKDRLSLLMEFLKSEVEGEDPKLSLEEKRRFVQAKRACFICLKPGHIFKKFKASNIRCQVCMKKHYVSMCPDLKPGKKEEAKELVAASSCFELLRGDGTVLSNQTCSKEVLLQTLLVRVSGKNDTQTIRALIDTGSQKSYLIYKAVDVLGLDYDCSVDICHILFGGEQTKPKKHKPFQN